MGPLSVDSRKRVVSAVREEGMSCRAAAQRFGVSFSSAIRWVAALRERIATRRCRWAATRVRSASRPTRISCFAFIGASLTLRSTKSRDRLERARGEKVSPSSMIWRFLSATTSTFKKSPRTRVSRAARTSLSGDGDRSNRQLDRSAETGVRR